MTRLPLSLALTAVLALAPAALAQNVTTTTATVGSVKITGSKGAPTASKPATPTGATTTPQLQNAHPALPTVTPPQSGDKPS
jgi:hypothetical protein